MQMHKESKNFSCGRKRLADEGLGADYGERGVATKGCGHERGGAPGAACKEGAQQKGSGQRAREGWDLVTLGWSGSLGE